MFFSPNIHSNAIDRIGTIAVFREQAIANGIQAAQLRLRAKYILAVVKCEWSGAEPNIELRVKYHIEAVTSLCSSVLVYHDRLSIAKQYARAKSLAFYRRIVVACIARPASPK